MVLQILIILFTIFSSYTISAGDELKKNTTAVPIDHAVTDGENFVNKIIHGQKLKSIPDYLLFTAPYRLCDGECQKDDNFVMAFPLFVGNKGKAKFKDMYQRDYKNIHQKASEAPFRVKTTRRPYTLCPTLKSTKETTTTTPVETTTEPIPVTNTTKGPKCPKIPQGMCKFRNSNNFTFTAKIETLPKRKEGEPGKKNYYLTSSKNLQRTRKYSTVIDYLYDLY